MKRIVLGLFLLLVGLQQYTQAQRILTLDSCRTLAIQNNKDLLIQSEKMVAARYEQKEAFTNYLPKVKAQGVYLRNQKEFSLLSNEQKEHIGNAGAIVNQSFQNFASNLGERFPNSEIPSLISLLGSEVAAPLNEAGQSIVNGLRTDTRNTYFGTITVTQPLYMGGKIRAYNKITKYLESLAAEQYTLESQELLLNTDQTYWQVVSLVRKKELAESYVKLLQNLDSDLQHMIREGLATLADGLTVQVKLNEAEIALTKVEDGLSLSKMLLCQICGIDLKEEIHLADEQNEHLESVIPSTYFDMEQVYQNRPELRSLSLAHHIAQKKIQVVRADFLPSVALIGNYVITNPSLFNSFENKFRGMWNIGMAVQIPIWNWGEGIYKVKKAKSQARIIQLQQEEAKEKIELQVNQSAYKINEATKKLIKAEKNLAKAEENLRFANLSFTEGLITSNQVLEAHTAWLSAKSEIIEAQIDLKLTDLYFQKSIGTME
ncbi:MAG: TolC family protein [Bacteroidales bacterium]|nr:TolC family protein [Bacteroidales bacterium]